MAGVILQSLKFKHILAEPVPTSIHTQPPAYHPHKRPVGTDHELNPANQHKAIASICEINKDQYMKMSALMPETPGNPEADQELYLSNQHKAIASICMINEDQYM